VTHPTTFFTNSPYLCLFRYSHVSAAKSLQESYFRDALNSSVLCTDQALN